MEGINTGGGLGLRVIKSVRGGVASRFSGGGEITGVVLARSDDPEEDVGEQFPMVFLASGVRFLRWISIVVLKDVFKVKLDESRRLHGQGWLVIKHRKERET